jgi:hypothetical protein
LFSLFPGYDKKQWQPKLPKAHTFTKTSISQILLQNMTLSLPWASDLSNTFRFCNVKILPSTVFVITSQLTHVTPSPTSQTKSCEFLFWRICHLFVVSILT